MSSYSVHEPEWIKWAFLKLKVDETLSLVTLDTKHVILTQVRYLDLGSSHFSDYYHIDYSA